jgi:hypothetical protein
VCSVFFCAGFSETFASGISEYCKNYHPLAFKYQLQNKIANAEITKARGNFDPVLAGKLGRKILTEQNITNSEM